MPKTLYFSTLQIDIKDTQFLLSPTLPLPLSYKAVDNYMVAITNHPKDAAEGVVGRGYHKSFSCMEYIHTKIILNHCNNYMTEHISMIQYMSHSNSFHDQCVFH